MADAGIEPAAAAAPPAAEQKAVDTKESKKAAKKAAKKRDKPDDAVKLGCGGLFRRKKRTGGKAKEGGGENGAAAAAGDGEGAAAASKAPIEKPTAAVKPAAKGSSAKGTVKIEDSPQSQVWHSVVTNSMVGIGVFKRAAACSLATGGVLACCPAEFTPTVEQVAALRDNFDNRGVFSAAGFGVADTVFSLQEETGTPEILSGADSDQAEGVLVARSATALIVGTFAEKLDVAKETLAELRRHFTDQGL